jgi:DNA-binding XRE family transcriptional regulator
MPATFPPNRLEMPDDDDLALADFDQEDASANDRACNALIALRERKGMAIDVWARLLGLDTQTLLRIENGQLLDQPSASLLFRAAHLVGGELKIGFGPGRPAIKV